MTKWKGILLQEVTYAGNGRWKINYGNETLFDTETKDVIPEVGRRDDETDGTSTVCMRK